MVEPLSLAQLPTSEGFPPAYVIPWKPVAHMIIFDTNYIDLFTTVVLAAAVTV